MLKRVGQFSKKKCINIQILLRENDVTCLPVRLEVSAPRYFCFYLRSISSARILVLSTIDKDCRYLACNLELILGFAPYS